MSSIPSWCTVGSRGAEVLVHADGNVQVPGEVDRVGSRGPKRLICALCAAPNPETGALTAHVRGLRPACPSPPSPSATQITGPADPDHVIPYLPPARGGPPGQTGMHNIARLTRFPHRLKTHGRWRLRQPRPGVYEWTSPHGYRYLVDDTGTHPQGKAPRQDE